MHSGLRYGCSPLSCHVWHCAGRSVTPKFSSFEKHDQPHFAIWGPGRSCVALRGRVKQATLTRGMGCLLLGMLLRRRWKSTNASFTLEHPACMQTEVTFVRICRGYGAPIPCFRCRVPMVKFHLRVLGTVLRVTRSSHGRAPLIKLYR